MEASLALFRAGASDGVAVLALLGQHIAHSPMFDTVIFQSSFCWRASLEWLQTHIVQPVLIDNWL